jgi:hypothetical protein
MKNVFVTVEVKLPAMKLKMLMLCSWISERERDRNTFNLFVITILFFLTSHTATEKLIITTNKYNVKHQVILIDC